MGKFAVIRTGGKQYKVSEGDVLEVEKLDVKAGDKVSFEEVLLVADKEVKIGDPIVKDSVVEGEVVDQVKADKISGFKYKAKARYRRRYGHRQQLTQVKIKKIK